MIKFLKKFQLSETIILLSKRNTSFCVFFCIAHSTKVSYDTFKQ